MRTNVKKQDRLLRIGVLGCGTISQAGHLVAAAKAGNVFLEAICDVAEDLLEKMAAVYGPVKTYDDFDKMLADPDIDAVVIGIGDQFHVPCAIRALRAGKHVLVEKPMGVSVEECMTLCQEERRSGKLLQVGHMKRFDQGLRFARRFKEEKLGEIVSYRGFYCDSVGRYTLTDNCMPVLYSSEGMKKPAGDPKADREKYYLLGHGTHLFDTARFFMGDIESLSARFVRKKDVYSWLVDCDFHDGSMGCLELTVAIAQEWREGVEIYGTGGTVYAKIFNPWEFRSSIVECYDGADDTVIRPAAYDGQFYRRQLEGFADSILNQKPLSGASSEDGLKSLQTAVAVYQSVYEGGGKIRPDSVTGGL